MIKVERDRDRQLQQERQADQASTVAVWVGRPYGQRSPASRAPSVVLRQEDFYPDLYMVNGSRLPVYGFEIFVWVDFSEYPISWQRRVILPPTPSPVVASAFLDADPAVAPLMERIVGASVSFRDSEGHHWHRAQDGSLHAIDRTQPDQDTGAYNGVGFVPALDLGAVELPEANPPPDPGPDPDDDVW
ncbi:hypothetical protein [Streptomyces mirabilis]